MLTINTKKPNHFHHSSTSTSISLNLCWMDCIMDNQTPISLEEVRNWLQLPPDVLYHIFLKLGAINILFRAQLVCLTWRRASKEPLLFRSIDIRRRDLLDVKIYDLEKMTREAVDRSCGQLVEFSMDGFGSDELLAYIADKSVELRCLRLVSSYQVDALICIAKKAVMLEELVIGHCYFSGDKLDMLKTVGNACPKLKSFWLNGRGYLSSRYRRPPTEWDDEALAIAENMPGLCHLHLFGNNLTSVGLRSILDCCLHLESLDLRQCFNLILNGDLLKICRDRFIKLRLPNDSTDDYEFDVVSDDGSDEYSERGYFCDFDNDYVNEFSYLDIDYYDSDYIYDDELPFGPDYCD